MSSTDVNQWTWQYFHDRLINAQIRGLESFEFHGHLAVIIEEWDGTIVKMISEKKLLSAPLEGVPLRSAHPGELSTV